MQAPARNAAQVAATIYTRELQSENVALKAETAKLQKRIDAMNTEKIGMVHRHGAANTLLEKFTRRVIVRVFCRALRREAVEHIDAR